MSAAFWPYFDRPADAVEENIDLMNDRVDAMMQDSLAAITALGTLELDAEPDAPTYDLPSISVPSVVTPTAPAAAIFGTIGEPADPTFEDLGVTEGLDDTLLLVPGTFASTVGDPQIPNAPSDIEIASEPTAPATATAPAIPSAPSVTEPSTPTLESLTLPSFAGVTDPTFTDLEPVFGAVEPTPFSFDEPTYSSALFTATQAEILTMLAGGTGLTAAVEQALFDAARGREQQTALAAEQEAFDTMAGRGFSMPSGVLAEMVSVAQERSRFGQNTLSRDILSKSAEWEIVNMRSAIGQGIALEGQLRASFESLAQRTLEVAKSHTEIEVKIYEVAVALYNARQAARQIAATVYKAQWEGEAIKAQAYKAEVDGQVALGQINEQRVKVFLGQWEGVKIAADRYRTQMDGARIESEIDRNVVQNYATRVQAFDTLMKARKIPFEVWAEQMKGEQSRASILESQVRGFTETVKAQESEQNVKIKYIDLKLQAARASVEKYTARLQYMRDVVAAELANIQANAQGFVADTGRYSVELQGANQARSQELQVLELRLRNSLSRFDTVAKQFDAAMNRQVERAKIITEASKATAQASVALTAGAMSAIHLSAGMSGSGSVGVSESHTYTHAA